MSLKLKHRLMAIKTAAEAIHALSGDSALLNAWYELHPDKDHRIKRKHGRKPTNYVPQFAIPPEKKKLIRVRNFGHFYIMGQTKQPGDVGQDYFPWRGSKDIELAEYQQMVREGKIANPSDPIEYLKGGRKSRKHRSPSSSSSSSDDEMMRGSGIFDALARIGARAATGIGRSATTTAVRTAETAAARAAATAASSAAAATRAAATSAASAAALATRTAAAKAATAAAAAAAPVSRLTAAAQKAYAAAAVAGTGLGIGLPVYQAITMAAQDKKDAAAERAAAAQKIIDDKAAADQKVKDDKMTKDNQKAIDDAIKASNAAEKTSNLMADELVRLRKKDADAYDIYVANQDIANKAALELMTTTQLMALQEQWDKAHPTVLPPPAAPAAPAVPSAPSAPIRNPVVGPTTLISPAASVPTAPPYTLPPTAPTRPRPGSKPVRGGKRSHASAIQRELDKHMSGGFSFTPIDRRFIKIMETPSPYAPVEDSPRPPPIPLRRDPYAPIVDFVRPPPPPPNPRRVPYVPVEAPPPPIPLRRVPVQYSKPNKSLPSLAKNSIQIHHILLNH